MDVCLRCGADVRDDVVVSTVTEGVLPPAPPRAAYPVWEHPARPDPAWGPEDPARAPRPELSATAAAVRWLAVGGHALIAGYYALSLVVSVVAMAVAIRTIDGNAAALIMGTVIGVAVRAAVSLWLASRTRRLWKTYDARRFRGALPGDILVALMAGASGLVGAAGGQSVPLPLVLALVGVPAGVALLTVGAALLLPRPLVDGP
jgi:hypothetical protein